jgi:hypothetical protein
MSDDKTKDSKEFIEKFKRISSEKILREFEAKNREEIAKSSFEVKDAFDQVWIKVTGNSYYQPTTTVVPQPAYGGVNNTERSDPRSRQYRAIITFDKIYWLKLRNRKIGKIPTLLYVIDGETNGDKRPIYQNLTIERVRDLLGEKISREIQKAEDEIDSGEITGEFDLSVEGYWEVQFSPASSQTDPRDVKLMWEGQSLVIQRMKPVVLPGFYIEVADNATKDNYIQTPEQGRKMIGVIQQYPYTVLREASREEYLMQKSAGDAAMRDRIRRDNSM